MLLTVKQVAAILNVTESCVYAILRASGLPPIRIGFGRGTIRIEESDLDDFIRNNTVRRRGKNAVKPRPHAPSAFTHLNSHKMRQAWAARDAELPARQRKPCAVSGRQNASKPS